MICNVCAHAESRDYCLHETFNATCRAGSVLLMTSAVYGRMRVGRCIDGDYNVGCATDVLRYFDGECTARRACRVDVRNLVDLHPCQRDFMSYLEASYRCLPGRLTAPHHSHHLRCHHLSLPRPFHSRRKNLWLLKLLKHLFKTLSPIVFLIPSGLPSRPIGGHWRFFVLVSFLFVLSTCMC